ncbi:MAG: DUF2541 family protein [Flavobacteriaceae bacterium]|nr:DUF2541 family protein [Flavobacteriaceae bacterium]
MIRLRQILMLAGLFIATFSMLSVTQKNEHVLVRGWVQLGKQSVSEGVHQDELVIEGEKSNVQNIKIKVRKASINLHSIKVFYTDGTSESHTVSRRLEKGDATRVFTLMGYHRTLEKIVFYYNNSSSRGGAELMVMGKV